MIIAMSRLRILGPRDRMDDMLRAIRELGLIHLVQPKPHEEVHEVSLSARDERERAFIERLLSDIDAIAKLSEMPLGETTGPRVLATRSSIAGWVRLASRVRRRLETLKVERVELEEEKELIDKYDEFFKAFESLLATHRGTNAARTYHVILRSGEGDTLPSLRVQLESLVGDEFELLTRKLPSGETAVLLLVSAPDASRLEGVLTKAGIRELPVPRTYGADTIAAALPQMRRRREEIPRALKIIDDERRSLVLSCRDSLRTAALSVHDRMMEMTARTQIGTTEHAFVLEGWTPKRSVPQVRSRIARHFGEDVVVEEVQQEEWAGELVPVVLHNPRLLRPFETITNMLPLPSYGSIDPTPFVAVFFPMFFGVIMGDIGYGLMLATLSLILHMRSRPDTLTRSVSEIGGACAVFTIIFGALYGELFGDLGTRWFGLRPLAFDRAEAIIPFLGLAVALGVVHVFLGLALGFFSSFRRDRRHSMGQGLAAIMLALVIVALLATVDVLPSDFFTPAVIVLLVTFPVLVVLEGIVAPVELLSTIGNMLSYARIMALGTASVMMAVVANRMVGTFGSAVVGVLFALIFHLVNFVIGVFSPTIHALRLHYVEFFGKFYSPGGTQYKPYGHWREVGSRTP